MGSVHNPPINDGLQNFGFADLRRRDRKQIPVEHDQVRSFPGFDAATVALHAHELVFEPAAAQIVIEFGEYEPR